MTPLEVARRRRREVLAIGARRGVSNVRAVVGPFPAPDPPALQLVVDFDAGHPGLDLFGFAAELEATLGVRVEIGTDHDPEAALVLESL